MPPHVPYGLRGLPSRLWPKCNRLLRFGTPMRRSYVVPMRWMVIYEYGVSGRALNLSSTNLPRPWESSPSKKNSRGRSGNRTRDLTISSRKLWPLDHEAGRFIRKFWWKFLLIDSSVCNCNSGLNVPFSSCIICSHNTHINEMFHILQLFFFFVYS
jgi:hypothetical protein